MGRGLNKTPYLARINELLHTHGRSIQSRAVPALRIHTTVRQLCETPPLSEGWKSRCGVYNSVHVRATLREEVFTTGTARAPCESFGGGRIFLLTAQMNNNTRIEENSPGNRGELRVLQFITRGQRRATLPGGANAEKETRGETSLRANSFTRVHFEALGVKLSYSDSHVFFLFWFYLHLVWFNSTPGQHWQSSVSRCCWRQQVRLNLERERARACGERRREGAGPD